MVSITSDLRAGFVETDGVIDTADQIATYDVVIGETVKTLANIFSPIRKD